MSKPDQKDLNELINDLVSDDVDEKDFDEPEEDKQADVVEDEPSDEVEDDEPDDEPDVEDEDEEDDYEEPEDELMEYSVRGLQKLIDSEKLEIDTKGMDDKAIRKAIREARESAASDPNKALEDMRAWMNEQAQSIMAGGGDVNGVEGKNKEDLQEVAKSVDLGKPFEITDELYEKALTDRTQFSKVLNEVAAHKQQETIQKLMPLVNNLVQQQLSIHQMVTDFYSDNKDLRPYRQFVGFVANQVQSKHPDWDMPKIFQETEKIAREKLRMAKEQKAEEDKKVAKKNPSFIKKAKSSNRPNGKPKLSSEEKAMLELLEPDNF